MIDDFVKQLDGEGKKYTVCIKIHGNRKQKRNKDAEEAIENEKVNESTVPSTVSSTVPSTLIGGYDLKAPDVKVIEPEKKVWAEINVKKTPMTLLSSEETQPSSQNSSLSGGGAEKEELLARIRRTRKEIEMVKGGSASFEIDACLAELGISTSGFKLSEQPITTLEVIEKSLLIMLAKYKKDNKK